MLIHVDEHRFTPYNDLSLERINELYDQALGQKEKAEHIAATLEEAYLRKQIIDLVENHYDFGQVSEVFELYGGQINRSFGAVAYKNGVGTQLFIRKYHRHASETDIRFEHAVLKYVKNNGFSEIMGVYSTKTGETFVPVQEEGKTAYFAAFEFLDGEDLYRWWDDFIPAKHCYSIGVATAKFHNAGYTFDSGNLQKEEDRLIDLFPQFKEIFTEYYNTPAKSIYHQTFLNNYQELMDNMDKILAQIDPKEVQQLPLVPVNGDLHQGNLKYRNDVVVGMFDFDWVKIDVRLFEIAGVMLYATTSWQDNNDGTFLMDKAAAFLKGYQTTLRELGGFSPMGELEARYLPLVLQMACYYNIIWWSAKDHYEVFDTINVFEYDYYLRHGLRMRRFIEAHQQEITDLVNNS